MLWFGTVQTNFKKQGRTEANQTFGLCGDPLAGSGNPADGLDKTDGE